MTLTLALPSKGRLKDKAIERLRAAGFAVREPDDPRSYRASVEGEPGLEIAFLSASEIAREIGDRTVDLGVTGDDLVQEGISKWEEKLVRMVPLGFGFADVVVAIPDCWFDVRTMADLGDVAADFRAGHQRRLRIATKYWRLTQRFFSQLHGIQVYRIVESLGATEGAPAAGSADVIVDITSTGSTLRANQLRVLDDGVVLESQACLFASRACLEGPDAALARRIAEAVERSL